MNTAPIVRGFTLIELIVTIAVGAILAGMAVPSFREFAANNRLTSQVNALIGDLNVARSEALKRNRCISLTATDSTVDTNEWGRGGWTFGVDANCDGAIDAGGQLRVSQVSSTLGSIDSVENVASIRFQPSGFLATTALQFDICDNRTGEIGRRIRLATTGRVSNCRLDGTDDVGSCGVGDIVDPRQCS
jgi:type IV fimbrial biogenesis protein FimT